MKFSTLMMAATITAMGMTSTNALGKGNMVPKAYMFGFAASFTDSTVYFTTIQEVDSVWMDSKTKFLLGRDNYALQLKNMLASKMGKPNRTCIVTFDKNKKNVTGKYQKMLKLYTTKGKGNYDVRYIKDDDFHFKPIDMSAEETNEKPQKTQKSRPAKTRKPKK